MTTENTSNLEKLRLKYALILSLIICVLEVVGLALAVKRDGVLHIDYYTQQSNILSFVACAVMAYYLWRKLQRPKTAVPHWAILLKYASVVSLTITLLVVLFILIPMAVPAMGFWGAAGSMLLSTSMTYTHTLCPILALVLFLYFERHEFGGRKDVLWGLAPTGFYAVLALLMNILKWWHGPYPFLFVYEQPLWQTIGYAIVILGGGIGIAKCLELINRKIGGNKKTRRSGSQD